MPRLPKHHMMVDVAVLAASDSEEHLQRDAKVLLSQPHIRSVAVFEPRGVGLDESRAGVRHVAGDPDLEIIYKAGRGSQGGRLGGLRPSLVIKGFGCSKSAMRLGYSFQFLIEVHLPHCFMRTKMTDQNYQNMKGY